MIKRLIIAAVCALIALRALPAEANLGGEMGFHTPAVTPIYFEYVTQSPGITWTFQTSGLSTGADSVIHVQDADTRGFVAGNDDAAGLGLASLITVPPIATTRTL